MTECLIGLVFWSWTVSGDAADFLNSFQSNFSCAVQGQGHLTQTHFHSLKIYYRFQWDNKVLLQQTPWPRCSGPSPSKSRTKARKYYSKLTGHSFLFINNMPEVHWDFCWYCEAQRLYGFLCSHGFLAPLFCEHAFLWYALSQTYCLFYCTHFITLIPKLLTLSRMIVKTVVGF